MKKMLALLLAVCMLLCVLSACAATPADPAADNTPAETPASNGEKTKAPEETPAAPAENTEPVTVTVALGGINYDMPTGELTDVVAQKIKEATGITIEVVASCSDTEQYKTKLGALIAADDLPDLFWVPSNAEQILLNNAGLAYDATELVETNGQNLLADSRIAYALQFSKDFIGNGKLYYIPVGDGECAAPIWPTVAPMIRWDLYRDMGYPEVNSWDDYLQVLADMQAQFPTADNGKQAYGMGLFTDWGDWCLKLTGAWFGHQDVGYGMEMDCSDMLNLIPSYNNPDSAYFRTVRMYNKAYRMGILDPEFATVTYSQLCEKASSGQLYSLLAGWDRALYNGESDEGFAAIPYIEDDKFIASMPAPMGNYNYAINAHCEHPERVMDLLNYFASEEGANLLVNGIQGVAWDYVDGVKQYLPGVEEKVMNGTMTDEEKLNTYGTGLYANVSMVHANSKDPATGEYVKIQNTEDFIVKQNASDEVLQDFMNHYGYKTPGEPWFSAKYHETNCSITNAIPTPPDEIVAINANIDNYRLANVYRLILCETEEEFDAALEEFINEMNKIGIQQAQEWYASQWTPIAEKVLNY